MLDDVEAGEVYHITRNGAEIAEVRPLGTRRRFVPVEELQRRWRDAPAFDPVALCAEASDFFGGDDVLEDDNPWERNERTPVRNGGGRLRSRTGPRMPGKTARPGAH